MTDRLAVWLEEKLIGELTRSASGAVTFDYVEPDIATPLSASIPRSREHHSADVVMPWLDNLLPDNDDVRAQWAAAFGERRVTPFNLLRHIGADCAGAVQVLPIGQDPSDGGDLTVVSETEIADHIRALRRDSGAWSFPERGGRWSLGGQQGKFALARTANGEWLLPSGRAASTHIVKVGIAGVTDSDLAEYVTTAAAGLLGLTVPSVEYAVFDGEPGLVVTRFDRIVGHDAVRRIHQEDLCQALGQWRTVKYQADGGASVADVVRFLRRELDPRDREVGVRAFANALVFSHIVAGTDAHSKNYAILHFGSRTTFAPLYDLLATMFLWPAKQVHDEGRLAMKFGGEYRLRKVDAGRYRQAATDLGIDEDALIATGRRYLADLPDATRTVLNTLPSSVPHAVIDQMMSAVINRLQWITVA